MGEAENSSLERRMWCPSIITSGATGFPHPGSHGELLPRLWGDASQGQCCTLLPPLPASSSTVSLCPTDHIVVLSAAPRMPPRAATSQPPPIPTSLG